MNIDLLTVLCGKRNCLNSWLNYIKKLPFHDIDYIHWIIIDNADNEDYINQLKNGIQNRNLNEKFDSISFIKGPGKFIAPKGKDWRESDVCVGKHRSTGESFTLGFSLCNSEIVYTLDDDTIPPDDAFLKLINAIKDESVGASAGLYFNHAGWNTKNPWRNIEELNRTVVASIETDHWMPAMIDDYWDKGIVESGFVGTGITMWKTELVKQSLPLETIVNENTILGPDGYLCKKIREFGKRIVVDSSILCEHLDDAGGFAGIGVRKFMQNLQAQKETIMSCSFGDIDAQVASFVLAREICEQSNLKMILCWPKNYLNLPSQCPWITDDTINEIYYFDYLKYAEKFEMVESLNWKHRKIMDLLYYEKVNQGNYRKIFKFMRTTANNLNDIGSFLETKNIPVSVGCKESGLFIKKNKEFNLI